MRNESEIVKNVKSSKVSKMSMLQNISKAELSDNRYNEMKCDIIESEITV